MPRKKKSEIVLAANLQEAAIVNQVIAQSPVAGEYIECKTDTSYTKELVNEVDEAKLINTHNYYKWKSESLDRELTHFLSKLEITIQEMEFRGIYKEELV